MIKRKLAVRKDAQIPRNIACILQYHIPEFHRIFKGDKEGLHSPYTLVLAGKHRVGKTMPHLVLSFGKVLSNGLPGNRPIFSRIIIPDIDIVARAIEGNPIRPEPGNPVILGIFIKEVPPRIVGNYGTEILYSQVISPGYGNIRLGNYIFSVFIIKITILHRSSSRFSNA